MRRTPSCGQLLDLPISTLRNAGSWFSVSASWKNQVSSLFASWPSPWDIWPPSPGRCGSSMLRLCALPEPAAASPGPLRAAPLGTAPAGPPALPAAGLRGLRHLQILGDHGRRPHLGVLCLPAQGDAPEGLCQGEGGALWHHMWRPSGEILLPRKSAPCCGLPSGQVGGGGGLGEHSGRTRTPG